MSEKTILQYDLEGNFLKEWEGSMRSVAEELEVSPPSIGMCLRGEGSTSHGFQWRYRRPEKPINKRISQAYMAGAGGEDPIRVAKYFEGRLICVYNTIVEAAEKNWLNPQDIGYAIRSGSERVGGFTFKRIE